MLPINLPGIAVERTEDGPVFEIHAGCEGRPAACPLCGADRFIGHGVLQQIIMDLPFHGKFAGIHLARNRWRCLACGGTFLHSLDWIDDDHRATRRFVDRVASLSLERSFSDLAREYGVHEKTVRNIFYGRYAPVIAQQRFETPEYLGIDEIKIAGGLRGVITNISERSGIEFLPKNTSAVLSAYFDRLPNRGNVKAVAMDCAQHYRALARTFFPQAAVVADKFHILRAADLAVDKTRIAIRESIATRRGKLKLKRDKYILKTRERSLSDWEREQIERWRREVPLLGAIYDLKEEFYLIYEAKSAQEARMRFDTWRHHIPHEAGQFWAPILTTWGNWEAEILAYWNHPITNAYTECTNMLTRAIDSLGRGYSFDALRVKMLLAPKRSGVVTSYRTIRRKKAAGNGATRMFMDYASVSTFSDLEEVRQAERHDAVFGVDLAHLGEWLDAQEGGQGDENVCSK